MKTAQLPLALFLLVDCAGSSLTGASGQDLFSADKVYVKTNLHPDSRQAKLYSVNDQGLIPAIGSPPKHRTPSLDGNQWIYWVSRFDTMTVVFDDGEKVVDVRS